MILYHLNAKMRASLDNLPPCFIIKWDAFGPAADTGFTFDVAWSPDMVKAITRRG